MLETLQKGPFTPRWNLFISTYPIIILLVTLPEFFSNFDKGVVQAELGPTFISNIIFLGTTHAAFTFVLLLTDHRFKEILSSSVKIMDGSKFLILLTSLFVAIFYLYRNNYYLMHFVALPLLVFVPINHGTSQVFGFSRQYKSHSSKIQKEGQSFLSNFLRDKERFLFIGFTLSFVLLTVACNPFKNLNQNWVMFEEQVHLIMVANFVFVALIFLNQLSEFKEGNYNRAIYNLRLVLYPLVPYSTTAIYGILAIHGIDYTAMYMKIKGRFKFTFVEMGFIALFVYATFAMAGYGEKLFKFETLSGVHYALGYGLAFTHYIVDGIIFRMKCPLIRKHLAPIFNS